MKRFGTIVLMTMLLAGCGQAPQPTKPTQSPTTQSTANQSTANQSTANQSTATQSPTTQNSATSAPKQGPPKIPHKVTEGMVCKECHATGANGAPVSKHPERPNCINCHKAAE